jgi:hypothetical protein
MVARLKSAGLDEEVEMTWLSKALIVTALGTWMVVPSMAQVRVVVAPARARVVVGPRFFFGPRVVVPPAVVVRPYPYYYSPGFYYGPAWYYPYGAYAPRPDLGDVKIDTHLKDASVYVDEGYVGPIDKFKKFGLKPGNHEIELRDESGRSFFSERVQVLAGKTIELRPPA